MYTRKEIEAGQGLFVNQQTVIFQFGDKDQFVTAEKSAVPAPGWHLAGGAEPGKSVEWCDLR